jgi:hypothetical protein
VDTLRFWLFGIPKPTPTLPKPVRYRIGVVRVWPPAIELNMPMVFSWYEAI